MTLQRARHRDLDLDLDLFESEQVLIDRYQSRYLPS